MNIGFIANDSKKTLLQDFCIAYKNILAKHTLFATGTTGRLIEESSRLNVKKFLAGTLGGENQICTLIENDQIDLVIFMRDPNERYSKEQESMNIFKLCDSHNVPFATNIATAEMLVLGLDRGDLDWRNLYRKE